MNPNAKIQKKNSRANDLTLLGQCFWSFFKKNKYRVNPNNTGSCSGTKGHGLSWSDTGISFWSEIELFLPHKPSYSNQKPSVRSILLGKKQTIRGSVFLTGKCIMLSIVVAAAAAAVSFVPEAPSLFAGSRGIGILRNHVVAAGNSMASTSLPVCICSMGPTMLHIDPCMAVGSHAFSSPPHSLQLHVSINHRHDSNLALLTRFWQSL